MLVACPVEGTGREGLAMLQSQCCTLESALASPHPLLLGHAVPCADVNYADVLFANFGDRVKDWMTFNEPWITCTLQVQGRQALLLGRLHTSHKTALLH